MLLADRVKAALDHGILRSALAPAVNALAKAHSRGVQRIFYDQGVWMHETRSGVFAYPHPYVRLDLRHLDEAARTNFFWGYVPRMGDVVMDVGAGVGEETLTFSRAVGSCGKVICIEAHPRTYLCLEKLIQYNNLRNTVALHQAVTAPSCTTAIIEDSPAYLENRINAVQGLSVPANTIDNIHKHSAWDASIF